MRVPMSEYASFVGRGLVVEVMNPGVGSKLSPTNRRQRLMIRVWFIDLWVLVHHRRPDDSVSLDGRHHLNDMGQATG